MPQPLLNYDSTTWCSKHNIDVEPYDDACKEQKEITLCKQCEYLERQAYTIITKDERFKEFL